MLERSRFFPIPFVLLFSFSCSPPHHSLQTLLSPNFLFEVTIFMQFSKSTHSQSLFIYLHFIALVLLLQLWRNYMSLTHPSTFKTALLLSRPLLRHSYLPTDTSSGPFVPCSKEWWSLKYTSRYLRVLKAWNFYKGMEHINFGFLKSETWLRGSFFPCTLFNLNASKS